MCHDLVKMAKSLFNFSFSFLFFSLITKVKCGKVSCDKSWSHKRCDNGHRMLCHGHVTSHSHMETVGDRGA